MDISKYANTVTVWIGNWGKYNEGELVGEWITLPVADEVLDRFLCEQVFIGTKDVFGYEYEEYGIFDADQGKNGLIKKLGLDVGEHTNLHALNTLAKICSGLDDCQIEALGAYLEIAYSDDLYKVCNYALQIDNVDFYLFDNDIPAHCSYDTKLGYSVAGLSGLYEELDKLGITFYFDFEAYGRDRACGVTFTDSGWIEDDVFLDADLYDTSEIKEIAKQRFCTTDKAA